jgi:hypothetical protein
LRIADYGGNQPAFVIICLWDEICNMSNRASTKYSIRDPKSVIPWLIVSAALYAALAIYLYYPYFSGFTRGQWLVPLNTWIAALGGFLLSRRWVAGPTGSLLAGAIYGFTPFTLGLAKFHPAAGLLAASVPWLFLPAAVLQRTRRKWLGTSLFLLPFVVILLFFYLLANVFTRYRLFAAPLGAAVRLSDLAGFLAPLVLAKRGITLMGLYHVPVATLVLGVAMIWKARRYNLLVVLLIGLLLAFSKSFVQPRHMALLGVSPVLWLSIPLAWCAVLSGIGLQGLLEAGFTDRKWLLLAVAILSALSIVNLFLATKYFQVLCGLADGYARLFVETAKMYLLGAVATGIIFTMARQKLRVHWLRWSILCTALAVDIVLGARYVIDTVL